MNFAVEQWPRTHRLTVDEYHKMAEVGLLAPDARVELIEGVIVDMPPIGSRHAGKVNLLTRVLVLATGERAVIAVQQALRLGRKSEPQPDLAILRPRLDLYEGSHPTAEDVHLVIEVSDTTLKFDRGPKLALYARHGVPEVWVVDLVNNQLHCMSQPSGDRYRVERSLEAPAEVTVAALPDVRLELKKLFA
ncbi:MAG: Uma2 family endonuclease [Steroidobacteraceae bacterium]